MMLWKRKIPDVEMLEAIRTGGPAAERAIAHLYECNREAVVQYIMGKNGSEQDALDVFQDAIVSFVQSVETGKFQGNSTIRTYLFAISKRLWFRKFNKYTREENYKLNNPLNDFDDVDPERLMLEKDLKDVMARLLSKLKPKSQEVLLLWVQNYSMKEIAEKMGFKNDQVARNKKSQSLKELKNLVKQHKLSQQYIEELK